MDMFNHYKTFIAKPKIQLGEAHLIVINFLILVRVLHVSSEFEAILGFMISLRNEYHGLCPICHHGSLQC
jgi:hypothetical protein